MCFLIFTVSVTLVKQKQQHCYPRSAGITFGCLLISSDSAFLSCQLARIH